MKSRVWDGDRSDREKEASGRLRHVFAIYVNKRQQVYCGYSPNVQYIASVSRGRSSPGSICWEETDWQGVVWANFRSNGRQSEEENGGVTARDKRKRWERQTRRDRTGQRGTRCCVKQHKEPFLIHFNNTRAQCSGTVGKIEVKRGAEVFIGVWLWSKIPLTAPLKRQRQAVRSERGEPLSSPFSGK